MSKSARREQERPPTGTVTELRSGQQAARKLPDVMPEIHGCNSASKAHEDLWSRVRQETDLVRQATADHEKATLEMDEAALDYKAVQAEHPERPAPRSRQWMVAGGTLALDGLACYFAAEALSGTQQQTAAWAVLFLVLLGTGELGLDHYSDGHRVLWRSIACALGTFIALLGLLRYSFLATVGVAGAVAAFAGAILFTVLTASFVIIGYRALRVAETRRAWKARRRARAYAVAAAAARRRLDRQVARRNRLARAYLSRIRTRLVLTCTDSELSVMEKAVWAHLTGQDPA